MRVPAIPFQQPHTIASMKTFRNDEHLLIRTKQGQSNWQRDHVKMCLCAPSSFSPSCRLLSQRSMNGQLECHGSQEERKCQDRRPDPNNMEPLRVVDERFPILWWRIRLPGERGTVDRDGADDPDQDPD